MKNEFKKNVSDLKAVLLWVDHIKNNHPGKEVTDQLIDKLTIVCSSMITVNNSFEKKYTSMRDEIDCYKKLVKKMKNNKPEKKNNNSEK